MSSASISCSEIRSAYQQVEDIAIQKLLNTLPPELRSAYEDLTRGPAHERSYELVKAADKLSAYIKCLEEARAGNHEFRSAQAQTLEALHKMELPELEYFLEHFMPAFELDLDQLRGIDQ